MFFTIFRNNPPKPNGIFVIAHDASRDALRLRSLDDAAKLPVRLALKITHKEVDGIVVLIDRN